MFFFLLKLSPAFSQKSNFTNYNVNDGLPQSTVYEIFQDHNGFLWLGTDGGGLCRYDGYRFKSYGKREGLKTNIVKKIVQDAQNTIWIATNGGLYRLRNDSVSLLENIKENNSIYFNSVFIDSKQNIWASTSGRGIFKITPSGNSYIVKNYLSPDGLSGDYVFDICEDNKNRLWIASFGNGLDLFDASTNTFKNIKQKDNLLNEVISLKMLKPGELGFGTRSAGAYLLNTDNPENANCAILNGTQNTQVWSIEVDEAGKYWIATDKAGVVCSDPHFNLDMNDGLETNKIFKVFIDREKNTWIGTANAGISKYSGNRFIHLTSRELEGLELVAGIANDKNNNYWLGTSAGLYNISYSRNGLKPINIFTEKNGLASNDITGLCFAPDQSLWISTRNGLSNYKEQKFKNYSDADGLGSNNINCVLADTKGRVWIGTDGGLTLLNEQKQFSNISESNGLINNEVQALYEDVSGNIWIGTLGGLVKYDGDNLYSFNEEDGLTEKKIQSLAGDKNSCIYIGTSVSGIYRYDPNEKSKKKISQLCPGNVLASNNIYSLTFENDSLLIVATNKGLNKIKFSGDNKVSSVSYLGESDGFRNVESSVNGTLRNNDGNIWFGTPKGVTIYQPEFDKINNVKPNMHLKSIQVNGASFPVSENFNLNHNQNSLKISFVSVSLTNPANNIFYAKLIGLDTSWNKILIDKSDLDEFAYVEYKKLQPGNYTLLLKSSNNDGVESEAASLKFMIALPFFKTKWFILASICIFILMVYLFFKYRERSLIKEKEKLEQIVTERTAEVVASKKEIEAQKDLVELQKHEITDSINYSKRIQNAILPEQKLLFNNFNDSFILYQPKDIVSGDFYFFDEGRDGIFYLGVADCTGHGVPGAFMSMVGSKELAEAIKTHKQPSEILSALNVGIRKTLKQSNLEIGIKDGMDIGFLSMEKIKNDGLKILYSGANRPLWILKKNEKEISEIKATKTAIGGYTLDDHVFAQHELILEKGDAVYLFSDGYADQFGGDSGKKMMTKRFKELLCENSSLPMKEKGRILSEYFQSWKGNTIEQVDDVLVIGLRA